MRLRAIGHSTILACCSTLGTAPLARHCAYSAISQLRREGLYEGKGVLLGSEGDDESRAIVHLDPLRTITLEQKEREGFEELQDIVAFKAWRFIALAFFDPPPARFKNTILSRPNARSGHARANKCEDLPSILLTLVLAP